MKNKAALVISILTILVCVGNLFAENRALIVGIADYGHPRLNLRGPRIDVELTKRMALALGFKESQIRTLLDKKATRDNILKALAEWCIKGVGPGDKVLIYFSGHGAQVPDFNGDEDDLCDEALVAADVVQKHALAFIVDDLLNRYLSRSKSKEILVILDCCHSGTGTKGMVTEAAAQANEFYAYGKMIMKGDCRCNQPVNMKSLRVIGEKSGGKVNHITLTAAAQNEVARAAMRPGRGSLFTQSLFYEVSSRKGPISFQELRDRVAEKIRIVSEAFHISPHTPQLEGNPRWFKKDFKAFIRQPLDTAAEQQYNGAVMQSGSMVQLFNRMLINSSFDVRIKAKKQDYKLGEKIRFSVISTKKGYLNLIELSPSGDVVVLFPNQYSTANAVTPWQTLKVPDSIGGFHFVAQPPLGSSRVVALVTPAPLNLYTEPVGKLAGKFKTILAGEFQLLKQAMHTRAIGVVPDKPDRHPTAGKPSGTGIREYGAADIVIKVEK